MIEIQNVLMEWNNTKLKHGATFQSYNLVLKNRQEVINKKNIFTATTYLHKIIQNTVM